jgi:hypothetical protein
MLRRHAQRRVQVEPIQVRLLAAATLYPRRAATGSDRSSGAPARAPKVRRRPIELA